MHKSTCRAARLGSPEMVKFSKEFDGQLIPEWKGAFVDYWQLKRNLKRIHQCQNNVHFDSEQQKNSMADKVFSTLRKCSLLEHIKREHRVIQVHRRLAEGDLYETELLEQFADTDAAIEFFACLDSQFNKVNQFYGMKEKELLERGDSLRKQMEILLELKAALKQKKDKGTSRRGLIEEDSISGAKLCESIRDSRDTEQGMENTYTDQLNKCDAELTDSSMSGEVGKLTRTRKEDRQLMSLSRQIIDCKGKSIRIHIPLTNPSQAFSVVSYLLCDELGNQSSWISDNGESKFHVNKKKLHCAEKMIRGAFIELYKGLGYLKTYRKLNMLAFAKILKKFDKVTNKQVLPVYLRVVESSYFNCSDKALKLADEVEGLFVKHFAKDDRRKAMKYLKPTKKKESHTVTFFTGLFTGCFAAHLVGYVIMAHVTGMYRATSDAVYMETVYPVLSMFSLMFLHFFLYGCNIIAWQKTRINYGFIFELSPMKELKPREVFLICSVSMAAVLGILFVHLMLVAKGYSYAHVQAIPGLLLLSFILVLVCPFNVVYKSSRYRFLSVIRNIILAPLYKVAMLDFFMADQLCSQVPMLRDMEYIGCYYITGSYKTQDYHYCTGSAYYRDLAYAVSFLPYYWRAMQCTRRWFDEGQKTHLVNLGKYVSAMLAAGAKVAYEKEKSAGWLYIVIVMSSVATLYQLYWDFVKDWGLLQLHSKNPWLRDELMVRRKFTYFFSMGLNLILRLAWLQTVFHYNFEKVDYRVTMSLLAALEVARRGLWNFYRLENEHLNNADKFRAVKTVALPFHEVDAQDHR